MPKSAWSCPPWTSEGQVPEWAAPLFVTVCTEQKLSSVVCDVHTRQWRNVNIRLVCMYRDHPSSSAHGKGHPTGPGARDYEVVPMFQPRRYHQSCVMHPCSNLHTMCASCIQLYSGQLRVTWFLICRVVPFTVNNFWKHYNSFISLWSYLNFWYVNYWRLIYDWYFILFFKILTISGQKRQICERTFNFFCRFLCGPNEFGSFCVGFFSGKTSSFKKS